MKEKWVYGFDELGQEHNDIVGKKCANLGEMIKIGMPVPPGFALTVYAYEKFMKDTKSAQEMREYLDEIDRLPQTLGEWNKLSNKLIQIVESKKMPTEIEDVVLSYYDKLSEKIGVRDPAVSTRSAGAKSHPGQYATYLNVQGRSELINHIIKVWSSSFNTRSLIYRSKNNMPIEDDPIGVAVVRMVRAQAAGVTFTVHPSTGDPVIFLESNWGLGESVVSGAVTPDTIILNKDKLEVIEKKLGDKSKRIVYSDTGVKVEEVPGDEISTFSITDEEAKEIGRLCLILEKHFGLPQDAEWAVDMDSKFPKSIFLLQTRPVTTIEKQKASTEKMAEKISRYHKDKSKSATDHIADIISRRLVR